MSKTEDLDKVTNILLNATEKLGELYFQLPISNYEGPIYRERVYCYELYHLMRQSHNWMNYTLNGEVTKKGHPVIDRIAGLKGSIPDLLVHEPGNMDNNLLVVEVKPAKYAPDIDDLKKLSLFCEEAKYHAAYYLVYGECDSEQLKLKCQKLAESQKIDLSKVKLFLHQTAGQSAKEEKW